MIHVIMGLKGSGKTKKLIGAVHETVEHASGDVVCIEYGKKLTYDVTYKVRLVDSQEYGIRSVEMLKGFVSGMHAGNFDITHVFIDNLYKLVKKPMDAPSTYCDELIEWIAKFAADNSMEITVALSEDPANASEALKQYL